MRSEGLLPLGREDPTPCPELPKSAPHIHRIDTRLSSRLPPRGGTCASIQRGHQVFTLEWIHSSMQLSSVVSGLFYLAINKFKTRYMKTS